MPAKTLAILLCSTLFATAQSAPIESRRAPLAVFIGHWEGSGKFAETKFSKPQTVTSSADCNWTPQGSALVCEMVVHDSQGEHRQLSIDTPDSEGSGYTYYTVNPGRRPFYGDLQISGATWVYAPSPEAKDQYPQFRTTNVFSGDTETFKTEFTEDGTHWVTMLEGTMKRTGK
ncbi:MAG TPA: hypothetical protein VMU28_04360 [Terriglobales bacterium]|nr:hypothetical protein [Terriglobales bacterium]